MKASIFIIPILAGSCIAGPFFVLFPALAPWFGWGISGIWTVTAAEVALGAVAGGYRYVVFSYYIWRSWQLAAGTLAAGTLAGIGYDIHGVQKMVKDAKRNALDAEKARVSISSSSVAAAESARIASISRASAISVITSNVDAARQSFDKEAAPASAVFSTVLPDDPKNVFTFNPNSTVPVSKRSMTPTARYQKLDQPAPTITPAPPSPALVRRTEQEETQKKIDELNDACEGAVDKAQASGKGFTIHAHDTVLTVNGVPPECMSLLEMMRKIEPDAKIVRAKVVDADSLEWNDLTPELAYQISSYFGILPNEVMQGLADDNKQRHKDSRH